MSASAGSPQGLAWWGSGGIMRREISPQFGWMIIVIVVGFMVVWPIVQLQWRAFADNASAFTRMSELPRIGDTVRTTVILALMSSLFAVVLGTTLAWCASLLPRRVQKIGELAP